MKHFWLKYTMLGNCFEIDLDSNGLGLGPAWTPPPGDDCAARSEHGMGVPPPGPWLSPGAGGCKLRD